MASAVFRNHDSTLSFCSSPEPRATGSLKYALVRCHRRWLVGWLVVVGLTAL